MGDMCRLILFLNYFCLFNIGISMTTKYDPFDNAIAERINGTLKKEFDLGDRLPDQKNAETELNKAVWIYNNLRPHESCYY